jgi:hypothetical protein
MNLHPSECQDTRSRPRPLRGMVRVNLGLALSPSQPPQRRPALQSLSAPAASEVRLAGVSVLDGLGQPGATGGTHVPQLPSWEAASARWEARGRKQGKGQVPQVPPPPNWLAG